jgi:aspartokinase
MKAEIKIFTFNKEFTPDQREILRRYLNVLKEHNLSVSLVVKKKKERSVKLRIKKTAG